MFALRAHLIIYFPSLAASPRVHFINSHNFSAALRAQAINVLIDQNLSFNNHISYLRKYCYSELRKISFVRPFLDHSSAVKLCISLVLSKLDCCNCLFYGMSNDNFHKLQLIQNHAARLVKRMHKRSSASCLLKELHWLPIKYRVMYKVALIVFKCLNTSEFPSYLKDLICLYTPSRTLRSGDKMLLHKPFKHLNFGQRSFHYAAPEVWNSLPFDLRACANLNTFKKNLKTHLFRIAFS